MGQPDMLDPYGLEKDDRMAQKRLENANLIDNECRFTPHIAKKSRDLVKRGYVPPQDKYKEHLLRQHEKQARALEEERLLLFKPKINLHSEQIVRGLEANPPPEPSPAQRLLDSLGNLAARANGPATASKLHALPLKPLRADTSKSFRKQKRDAAASRSKAATGRPSPARML